MCVVIDTSLAAAAFRTPPDPAFAPIFSWLLKKDGVLVYGGHLLTELTKVAAARDLLLTLQRAGRAKLMNKGQVDAEEVRIAGACRSNDPHVIALARVSGARTLCTNDDALMTDFKDRTLVPTPKGRIYKDQRHAHTLVHTAGCVRLAAR